MQYSNYNYDINTNYNSRDQIEASLFFEKMRREAKPRVINPLAKPIPKPSKDLYFFEIGTESLRDGQNPGKKKRHAHTREIYVPPYYSPKETGYKSVRSEDIFRKK